MEITKRFEFDAAHRIVTHLGKCRNIHGHRYVAEVTLEQRDSSLSKSGMLMDFGVLKRHIGKWIDQNWDHAYIAAHPDIDPLTALFTDGANSQLAGLFRDLHGDGMKVYVMSGVPTAENMAVELLDVAAGIVRVVESEAAGSSALAEEDKIVVTCVRLWETPDGSAVAYNHEVL